MNNGPFTSRLPEKQPPFIPDITIDPAVQPELYQPMENNVASLIVLNCAAAVINGAIYTLGSNDAINALDLNTAQKAFILAPSFAVGLLSGIAAVSLVETVRRNMFRMRTGRTPQKIQSTRLT